MSLLALLEANLKLLSLITAVIRVPLNILKKAFIYDIIITYTKLVDYLYVIRIFGEMSP